MDRGVDGDGILETDVGDGILDSDDDSVVDEVHGETVIQEEVHGNAPYFDWMDEWLEGSDFDDDISGVPSLPHNVPPK